jgi:hypothetical protein
MALELNFGMMCGVGIRPQDSFSRLFQYGVF